MKKLITILLCMFSSLFSMSQTSTVTLTSAKQNIRGFGGINLPEWQGSDLTTAQRNTAFGNGSGQIGMSVLRIYVSDNTNDWSKALATAKVAISMGLTVFATPWNPPASMCETVTRNNRQEKRLKYASYSDYAQHLIDFNNYMKNNGVNLYAMSFANEPDWGFTWTWYSIDEVYNFVTSQAAKLRVNGVKVITAESFSYNKSYYDKILNDPAALANIDIIGCHLYGSDATSPNSFFQYPLADQLATGKERWVTEHYTDSNNDADLWPMAHDVSYEIYRSMVEGQMSVYTWWYIRRSYGPIKEDGTVSKRGYCMSQYSKFIRPGYVRVDATKNPTTDVYISAYKKGDDVVIVAVNRATSSKTITLSIPGTKVTTWDKYVTSGTKNVAQESSINSSTGSFQITLDAQSTTSFVGVAPVGTPTASITAAGPVTFCSGGNVVMNAATGTGYVYQWKKDGSTIANATSSSYTATQSGSYTVTVTGNSQTVTSNAIVITVNALPSAPTVTSPLTYCQNATAAALTATGTSLKWYTVATGGTSSATAPTPATSTAGIINYYVSQTTNACEGTRALIAVTINGAPSVPTTTSSVTYCQNATATQLTAIGTSLKWYTIAIGGTGGTTAPTPTTSTAGTINYYVSQTTNACEGTRATIAVTVNALPSAPTVTSPLTYCQNATAAALTAIGTSLKWYIVATGGTSSATAPTPLTGAIGTTNYYVSQTTNNCEGSRATIAVTVNALPSAPGVISPVTYCQNATATALTATGNALKWYIVSTGGTGSATAPTPTTTAAGTTNYYVSQTTNGCEGPRSMIGITVNAIPSAPTVSSPVSYCQNATAATLTATGTSLLWYTVSTGGTASATAPTPSTATVGITNYYVSQTINGCEGSRALITVRINPLPTATITSGGDTTFCQGGSVTLTASAGSSYAWFNGANQVGTNATYMATTTGSYTVQITNPSNCQATSSATTVTVNSLPAATITAGGPTTFSQGSSVILNTNTGTGLTYRWLNGTTQVGTNATYTAIASGDYTVEVMNAAGCKSTSTVISVTVNPLVNQAPAVSIIAPASNVSYTSPANVMITAIATDADGTVSKVDFYNGGVLLGTDPTSTYNFAFNNLSSGVYIITAIATDNSGASTESTAITITVNPPANQLPVVTITSPLNGSTYVETATVTINAEATDGDGTIMMVEFYNGSTLLGSDASSPYSFIWSNVTAGTYDITAKATDNNGGVGSSSIVTITVTANQPSVIMIISPVNNSTATGTSVMINVAVTDPDGSITLVEYYDGTTLIGSSTTQPYNYTWNNPTPGTHDITVKVTDSNGGVTTSSASTITVQTQTGIFSISGSNVFNNVYPIPANNEINIETSLQLVSASLRFLDALGSEVRVPVTVNGTDANADVSSLVSGVYTLLITQDDLIIRKKIIVIH